VDHSTLGLRVIKKKKKKKKKKNPEPYTLRLAPDEPHEPAGSHTLNP